MQTKIRALLNNFISSEILKRKEKLLDPNQPLISGGIIDSFSLVDIALFVEDTWGVRIDETELNADSFDTVNELAALIQQKNRD